MITLGAIHERWLPCIKREVEVESCYEYWLHLASEPLSPVEVEAEVKLPEGCWLGQVGEEYVEEVSAPTETGERTGGALTPSSNPNRS